jgi:hypothetical protein
MHCEFYGAILSLTIKKTTLELLTKRGPPSCPLAYRSPDEGIKGTLVINDSCMDILMKGRKNSKK